MVKADAFSEAWMNMNEIHNDSAVKVKVHFRVFCEKLLRLLAVSDCSSLLSLFDVLLYQLLMSLLQAFSSIKQQIVKLHSTKFP